MKLATSLFAAGALVVGATAMSASAAVFTENAAFGSDPPVGALEWNGAAGFSSVWDFHGRVLADAEVISDSTIHQISHRLWMNDADLWQINVTDAANFRAKIDFDGGGHTLALFDSAGNALAGLLSTGPSSIIADTWLTGNGIYYLGVGAAGSNPRNAAGENLFNLVGTASGPITGDIQLAADPAIAWEKNNQANGQWVGPGNFTNSGSGTVNLAIPEPASMALLGFGGLAMLRRR